MNKEKIKQWSKSPLWPAILSALVVPGAGQIANRDYQKGILLLVSFIGSFLWFSKNVTQKIAALLPGSPDQWMAHQDELREALTKLIGQNQDMFFTFQILLLLLWTFGVVDAYLGARKKKDQLS
jgi:hypothetical protein